MAANENISGFPSFFKLILAPRLDLQKLAIREKFLKKYGHDLSDRVSLNLPTGAEWEVKLVRQNGKAWLQSGWPEFVEFYAISHGHFLVFRYIGHSSFDVFILDMTACEIEYRVDVNAHSASHKRKRDFTNSARLSPPKTRTSSRFSRPENLLRKCSLELTSIENRSKKGVAGPDKVIGQRCVLSDDEKKMVENYECKQPSFVVKMKPSQVSGKHNLNLPLEFVRSYLETNGGEFELQSVTGKTWLVSVVTTSKTHVSFISKGWRGFAVDNKLRLHDICVFELIRKRVFKVGVIHAAVESPTKSYSKVKLEAD